MAADLGNDGARALRAPVGLAPMSRRLVHHHGLLGAALSTGFAAGGDVAVAIPPPRAPRPQRKRSVRRRERRLRATGSRRLRLEVGAAREFVGGAAESRRGSHSLSPAGWFRDPRARDRRVWHRLARGGGR